jgi:glycosyltransferase involved in cell wall biosynthesis
VRKGQRDDRLAVTGYVVDERAYLDRAAVLALPLRIGGGSRLKALIAMASGVPIVSTRVGMEGLEAVADEHYLCAESADEWAGALCRVLQNASLRARLAANGRALVEDLYDWSTLRASLQGAYGDLLR